MDELNTILADYGFPSVLDGACETQADYLSVIGDAWLACDQTDEDRDACVKAEHAIRSFFAASVAVTTTEGDELIGTFASDEDMAAFLALMSI